MFFHYCWYFFGSLWLSFGSFLESLSSLWRAGVILERQNRAPMQVKLNFSQNHSFLGFHERRFTCMGVQFSIRIELPCRYNCYFRFKKTRFPPACFFTFFYYFLYRFGGIWVSFGAVFGASVVSLACWGHPCTCLWLAWAVCGLSLLLFIVPVARLGCLWARGLLQDRFFG